MRLWRHRGLAAVVAGLLLCASCRFGRPLTPPDTSTAPSTVSTVATTARPTTIPAPAFEPTSEVAGLTRSMSDEGKRLFYGARPEVLEMAPFAAVCPKAEHGNVLGCFTGTRIYILRVPRPELVGVMETTAVHEMLHAAYSALPPRERSRIDGLVGDLYAGVKDRELQELVASYEISEPGQRLNELHSLLPTQVRSLNPALEAHYRRYLTSRLKVVDAYEGYRGTLEQLEGRIDALNAELGVSKTQLAAMEARLAADEAALEELNRRLEQLKAQGKVKEFNQLIPQQNEQVRALRALADQHNQLVSAHNAKVQELNGLALEQDQLVDSLGGGRPAPP
ncbi:MAG: hypothetical protein WKF86_06485 [Acidimicrobiales bacterium]